MTALPARSDANTAPDNVGAVFQAVADALITAATYAETGLRFAEIRDAKGLAYATRCAAASIATAADLVVELRPSQQGGRRP